VFINLFTQLCTAKLRTKVIGMVIEGILKEGLYTITDVASLLGVSYTTARLLIRKANVRYIKIGRIILVPESEVRKLMELRKQRIIKNSG